MWIDTHAHLNTGDFAGRIDEVLAHASQAGVDAILVIGTDRLDSKLALELALKHPPLFAVVGLQPNNLNELQPGDFEEIARLAEHPRVVAVGETGMDRYWKTVDINLQEEYFFRHLELARAVGKPVVIHCREAEEDIVRVTSEFAKETNAPLPGVMHSYTGDVFTARRCLDVGLSISFAGMVTFKKNDALRDVAKIVPLDRLLIETDSPYLAPEPVRGKQNEPANVRHTGACLARVREMTVEALASATSANARQLFKLPMVSS